MKTFDIITLTINPSLDKSTHFSGLVPDLKIQCDPPQYDAGGGGVNVSKAICRLGTPSLAVFTSGGQSGTLLVDLLQKEKKITLQPIPTQNPTRENFIASDKNTNAQYRFGFSGAPLTKAEQQRIVGAVQQLKCNYFVLSGSLNEGVSSNFYQRIATIAKANGAKVIADTSGEALQKVLDFGVFLVKPNVGELAKLIGVEKLELDDVPNAAQKLIEKGSAEIVVVSLGSQGAILVTKDQIEFVSAPHVVKKSTVGAGDSMVGAMVWALVENKSLKEVIQWGVACGTAATMNEGTALFKTKDAQRLFQWLQKK